ncbi:Transcriptional regulator, MarR family [Candidatus Filomicrobium marinum]|uniref:Transcriptional regulator, MarR family n=3 Tax=Hyphomicrobiaceae TaxID=45401 RepID=A0A0D6JGI9_9HYPH|nr:Transcriptional regulator, MarR family [Candidatus Filomicrobium marinum]CPR20086.1 Transcriptional regulator, MarR family [Candidatus Filomicrobium marinum]
MDLPEVSIGRKYVNMTDINDPGPVEASSLPADQLQENPGMDDADALQRERLIACIELLFFAYRDFTGDPDVVLERYGFGRAHHRVLHFVHRNPGLRVADLLDILKITKQSLGRVLKQLIDEEFIAQRAGKSDRRQRLLFTTAKGAKLVDRLTELQLVRIRSALDLAGPGADEAARRFLFAMIRHEDRAKVEALIRSHTGSKAIKST